MNEIIIKRVYSPWNESDGKRILIDRLWPRGVKRDDLGLYKWEKNIAPSSELRKWFSHKEELFSMFQHKYIEELENNSNSFKFVEECKKILRKENVILLYAAKDEKINHAIVLKGWIDSKIKKEI